MSPKDSCEVPKADSTASSLASPAPEPIAAAAVLANLSPEKRFKNLIIRPPGVSADKAPATGPTIPEKSAISAKVVPFSSIIILFSDLSSSRNKPRATRRSWPTGVIAKRPRESLVNPFDPT